MEMTTLSAGSFYGKPGRSFRSPHFALTESRYNPGVSLPIHSHENPYFVYILRGNYKETFAGNSRTCGPFTIVFHPAGEKHHQVFHSSVHLFRLEILKAFQGVEKSCRIDPTGMELHCTSMRKIFSNMYREFQRMDDVSPIAMEGLALLLLAEASRTGPHNRKHNDWLIQARDFIQNHHSQKLSLRRISQSVGIHPVYLSQQFVRYYGTTIGDYIRRLRVDSACKRLTDSKDQIADIAISVGFCDHAHFCRAFKEFTGMTPTHYRLRFQS
jgi:AraC family transcriptional regulator